MTNLNKSLEDILGGKIERISDRVVPGIIKKEGSGVIYFSVEKKDDHKKQFRKITNHTNPPFAKFGGVSESGCFIKIPDGTFFYALTYSGDLEGWEKDIDEGASANGSILAKIDGENIKLSNGIFFHLSACEIVFN